MKTALSLARLLRAAPPWSPTLRFFASPAAVVSPSLPSAVTPPAAPLAAPRPRGSLYPTAVPPDFPPFPARPRGSRKKPSQLQRPLGPLPPLVAVHPQSGNRPVLRTPPGRLPLARLVSTEELARVRALLRSGGDGGGDGGGSGGEDDAVATAAAAAAGAPPPVPPSRRWVTKTERTSSLRFLRCRKLGLRAHRLLFPPASVADPAAARFAVVALGGRQYKVSPGDVINAERLPRAAVGDALTLVPLLVGSRDTTLVGRPTVAGAAVRLVVQEHVQDAKVVVFKKKRRKRYQKLQGHRRELTRLRVEAVDVDLAAY